MKTYILIFLLAFSFTAFAQFRDNGLNKPDIKNGITNGSSGTNFLGFLNADNFRMRHTFSLSYTTFGGNGISLGTYTNSMYYKLMDNMNVQADISMTYSPYSSFGKESQNQLSGIYLSRAAINYSPFKNMQVTFQYRNLPYGSYYYSPFYSGFGNYYYDPFYNGIDAEQ
jgi:hypothetical protein